MSCLFKFLVVGAIVFCFADLIPFPDLPPGLIYSMMNQHQQPQR